MRTLSLDHAVALIPDGASRMIGGFMAVGTPEPVIVKACTLPITSVRPIDLLVSELAAIAFPDGCATLLETARGVSVQQVLDLTDAELVVPEKVPFMAI